MPKDTVRLPPQNLDAERGVLGSILLLNEAIDEVGESLKAEHFYHDAHHKIYAAIHHLYENNVRGIDPVTLAEELEKRDPVISKVPLLKHSRDKFIPEIIRKMGAMELDEEGQALFEGANEWLETRSSGVFRGRVLSKEEVSKRKMEAALIIQKYNRNFSRGDSIRY